MSDVRTRTLAVAAGLVMAVTAGVSVLPALLQMAAPPAMSTITLASRATATPSPTPSATPTTPVTFASQRVVGPGADCCFLEGDQWATGPGGEPGFNGPARWSGRPAASFQWSLGTPTGGRRWDQVRVQTWIPNVHAEAWVRYTVTSTDGSVQSVRSFDVSQQALNGWYTLPGTFRIGTPTGRTGTIVVLLTELRPFAGMPAGGADMGAAQMRFEWS